MDDIDALLEALRSFYANLEILRALEEPELLLRGRPKKYTDAWEAASSALVSIEAAVGTMNEQLSTQKRRLDEGMRKYGRYQEQLTDDAGTEEE